MGEVEKAMNPAIHFVLIHGISSGSWCWYKIKCLMEKSGLKVTCIDLKSAGIDPSDANSILSFDDYNKPLLDFMSSLPHHEQVVLVGHSAGGLSVTQVTHKFPKKIRLAVYVAATMIKLGFLTDEDTRDDCALASMLMRPGPLMALTGAKFKDMEDEGAESVARVYIKTMYDNVVKAEQQDAMIKRWPPAEVFVLETDHSPFFSSPFLLFGFLLKAATSIGHSSN
ncbi:methylesterase 17-like isoform X1 [Tripterygium wilfordii]|uniref:methylesterase 17-like isoform X1 n=1 Tax=Tripterygium wilfordii TaxID=458696 RepID=UPI0018F80FDE|nr:methylesterase 17-like isoform X1 [Tripterygium wilfordii]